MTKRHRLFQALSNRQKADRCGNNVVVFIRAAMNPVRYVNKKEVFDIRKDELNIVLSFSGFSLHEDGTITRIEKIKTISDARKRASR